MLDHFCSGRVITLLMMLFTFTGSVVAEETQMLAPPPPVRVGDTALPEPKINYKTTTQTPRDSQRLKAVEMGAIALNAFGSGESVWNEGAEDGYLHVIDGTSDGYQLIQSERVAAGSNAFHLAHPGFASNGFELNVDIDVQPNTKLFFQSRLQYATPTQVAQVQVSTDAGISWSATVYSQAGTDDAGETGFTLREVDLGSRYAGQQIRIRFYYEFLGDYAYTDSVFYVGWLIDDIQIGSEFQKALYTIGDPSATEVLYLEMMNRARADALVEANRLAATTDETLLGVYEYFNVETANIISQFAWYVNNCMDRYAQPLAFRAELNEAADIHTLDMFINEFQGHYSSSNPPAPFQPGDSLGDRLDHVGYSGAAGENVYAYSESVEFGHAGFNVDWGTTTNVSSSCYNPDFVGQGMQNPSGHRINIHTASYNEVGMGVINDSNGDVGPQVVTQVFGTSNSSYVTGVIYEDLDNDGQYSAIDDQHHEGIGGVRVDVDGSAVYTVSTASGAYAIPVNGDGVYTVTFTGDLFEEFSTQVTIGNGQNVKLDHNPTMRSRYFQWAADYDLREGPEGDDDQDGIANILESLVVGMNPTTADAFKLPNFIRSSDGKMRLTLNKQTEADDLQVALMLSTDLINWVAAESMPNTQLETNTASQMTVAVDRIHDKIFARFAVDFKNE